MTVCVNCGEYISDGKLFIKYNNNSYKLLDCNKCGKIIDKYIEYDHLNILINIILLKKGVYTHLVYNSNNKILNKRLKYIVLSFEVYITWVYQEHLIHLIRSSSNMNIEFINKIVKPFSVIDFVFKQNAFWQYCFFIQHCFIEQWIFLKLVNYKFAKYLYHKNENSVKIFENTLLLSYISRLIFPILMLIWPYDSSIIIPSYIMKWLTNYYIIESVNLILHKNNNVKVSFNKLLMYFALAFFIKVLLQNIIINVIFVVLKNIVFPVFGWDFYVYDVELSNGFRFMKDFINQLALC
ncbi:hypothetical protein D499_0A01130 [Hanseniaspora uvarum DSM 2768]|nr:hypothetical protein D499_0A01130 [Hanseniaspora uvarum DSM 2768]